MVLFEILSCLWFELVGCGYVFLCFIMGFLGSFDSVDLIWVECVFVMVVVEWRIKDMCYNCFIYVFDWIEFLVRYFVDYWIV